MGTAGGTAGGMETGAGPDGAGGAVDVGGVPLNTLCRAALVSSASSMVLSKGVDLPMVSNSEKPGATRCWADGAPPCIAAPRMGSRRAEEEEVGTGTGRDVCGLVARVAEARPRAGAEAGFSG